MNSRSISVSTTATLIVPADNKNRDIYLHSSSGSLYIGGSDVTTSNGFHLANGESISIFVPIGETLHAISQSSSHPMIVLSPDLD